MTEQTQEPIKVKHIQESPETPEAQKANDDKHIPNVGDKRAVKQMGKITRGTEEIKTMITFIRTRNEQGGVDCCAMVPSLNLGAGLNQPGG